MSHISLYIVSDIYTRYKYKAHRHNRQYHMKKNAVRISNEKLPFVIPDWLQNVFGFCEIWVYGASLPLYRDMSVLVGEAGRGGDQDLLFLGVKLGIKHVPDPCCRALALTDAMTLRISRVPVVTITRLRARFVCVVFMVFMSMPMFMMVVLACLLVVTARPFFILPTLQ